MNEELLKEKSIQLAPVLFASLVDVTDGKGLWTKDYAQLPERGKASWIAFARATIIVAEHFADLEDDISDIVLAILK